MSSKIPLGSAMFDQFLGMQPHPTKCQATYVWIDVTGQSLRSKTRTLQEAPKTIQDYPVWNHGWRHDWTDQGVFYENILKPVAHFPDPFLGGQNRLVLCEEYSPEGQPVATNYRQECNKVMQECAREKPWFGIEQEYMLLDTDRHPLGIEEAWWQPGGGYTFLSLFYWFGKKHSYKIFVQFAYQKIAKTLPSEIEPEMFIHHHASSILSKEGKHSLTCGLTILLNFSTSIGQLYTAMTYCWAALSENLTFAKMVVLWPKNGQPTPIDETMLYYCGVGVDKVVGREVVEAHYRACLLADIEIAGTNAEATFGQWEFQIGICEGINMGDQLWMARYLLHRVAEKFGVIVSLEPMLPAVEAGKWFGSGCHTNFSSASTRAEGGIKVIEAAMEKLAFHQQSHLPLYGSGNEKRLTGKLFTPSMQHFTWGVADRAASVRIPQQVADEGKGYLEDRRPSSNCDPYRVTAAIASACLL